MNSYKIIDLPQFLPLLQSMLAISRPRFLGSSGKYYRSRATKSDMRSLQPLIDEVRAFFGQEGRAECIFLRTPPKSSLKPHVDNLRMMMNQALYMIQPATSGGILHLHQDGQIVPVPTSAGQVILFDANKVVHSVSQVVEGDRHVLAISFYRY